MKLQNVMNRYQLGITPMSDDRSVIRFRGGEWDLFGNDPFADFIKQLRDVAWTEQAHDSLSEVMSLGSTPEDAEREWLIRQTVVRQLINFFGVEIYEALLSTEEVLS